MRLINKDDIEIVDVFIRMYGDVIKEMVPHFDDNIVFKLLPPGENDYRDIMGRIGKTVYFSKEEVGRIGLSDTEMLAALAHEVGHIVYNTKGWDTDCEQRADTLAADLGLGSQMISAIEKIIDSRRYNKLTSLLIGRIHFFAEYDERMK